MDDFTRAQLERVFLVTPFTWIYVIRNPVVFIWRRLPETMKEPLRSFLGWPTWADYRRTQEEIRKRYAIRETQATERPM
jgi:hypothetical protein